MKRTMMGLVAGAAVLGAGMVGVPGASAALSQCPKGNACGWINQNFVGLSVSRNAKVPLTVGKLPDNDAITAIANKGNLDVGWYVDGVIRGDRYCETPGDSNPNVGKSWNDQFSSMEVYSTAGLC